MLGETTVLLMLVVNFITITCFDAEDDCVLSIGVERRQGTNTALHYLVRLRYYVYCFSMYDGVSQECHRVIQKRC